MDDLIIKLRKSTASLHQQLEARHPFSSLLDVNLQAKDYLASLHSLSLLNATMLAYLEGLPSAANVLSRFMPTLQQSAHKLKNDIDTLCLQQETLQTHNNRSSSTPAPTLQINNLGEAMGVLYVLIGSARGARIILPALQRSAVKQSCSHSYYTHQSRRDDWQHFTACLDEGCQSKQITHAQVTDGAKGAFTYLIELSDG